jgi:hypothetical protein
MNYYLSTIYDELMQVKSENVSFYKLVTVGIIFGYLISSSINHILSYICTIFLVVRFDSKNGNNSNSDSLDNKISEKPPTVIYMPLYII